LRNILRDILKFTLFLGVGITILYLVYLNQDKAYKAQCALDNIPVETCSLIDKVFADFQTVHLGYILLVMIFFNISNLARALRWKMMLESMDYKVKLSNAFLTVMLAYFANLGLPRIGEVIRATSFSKYENIRIEKLMGTIVLDRLLDMICVIFIVLLAITLEFDLIMGFLKSNTSSTETIENQGNPWYLIGGIALGLLVILFLLRHKIRSLPLYVKIQNLFLGFWEGIKSIKNIKKPIPFIFYSITIWLMYFLMTWVCFFAFDPTSHLGLKAGLVVFVFGTFGVIIPSPGGMGTFHALAVIALSFYAIGGDDAFSFANILFFSVQIGCTILLGIIALILLPIINRHYNSQHNKTVKSNQIFVP
jgi:glycosyltransferase 2 family protein